MRPGRCSHTSATLMNKSDLRPNRARLRLTSRLRKLVSEESIAVVPAPARKRLRHHGQ